MRFYSRQFSGKVFVIFFNALSSLENVNWKMLNPNNAASFPIPHGSATLASISDDKN